MKFGGTSVGSVASILSVKQIVENQKEPVIVVVSALGGITDKLIATAQIAAAGNATYKEEFKSIKFRHYEVASGVLAEEKVSSVMTKMEALFEELFSVYAKIYSLSSLSNEDKDCVVSFGERLSSFLISEVIDGCEYAYSPDFIKTKTTFGKHSLDVKVTSECISKIFKNRSFDTILVPGFIAKDKETGIITNLGRGGSDYTAAILAAELGATHLEIWTDVDGFMTADPRVISKAYVISSNVFYTTCNCNLMCLVINTNSTYTSVFRNIIRSNVTTIINKLTYITWNST